MYKVGDEVKYIGGIIGKKIEIYYSKVLEVDKTNKIIILENSMKLKLVDDNESLIWHKYRHVINGKYVLIQANY